MNARSIFQLAALVSLLCCAAPAGVAAQAPPTTPAALSPCAYSAAEVQAVFELTLDKTETSDMKLPGGRDVGCLYTFKATSFELAVRQTWESARPTNAAEKAGSTIPGDADGASWKAESADRPGAGGELSYLRGRVRTRVVVRGGRFTGTEVLKRLLVLRKVP